MSAENSAFERKGAIHVVFEHGDIVIGFQYEVVHIPNFLADVFGGMPEVGQPGEGTVGVEQIFFPPGKNVADGVVGIMGDGKGFDGDVSKLKGLSRFKDVPFGGVGQLALNSSGGRSVGKKFNAVLGQASHAFAVVGMFVSDEDGIDCFDRFSGVFEHLGDLFP